MPTSNVYQISKIMEKIITLNPQKLLDIGAGFGKYGVLCREYLELWDGRYEYNFKRQIDAVEVFSQYITSLHKFIYNTTYLADVRKILDKLINYDLILIIGTLEHFEKEEGMELLFKLLKTNKGILISTPKTWQAQEKGFGNEHEKHRSFWHKDDFEQLGNTEYIPDDRSLICYMQT